MTVAEASPESAAAAPTKKRTGKKRGAGEGSVYQRDDGLWVASVMVGRKVDGKPDRRVMYGKTRGDAQKKLDEIRRRVTTGMLGDLRVQRDTVHALLNNWLAGKKGTIDPESWRRHENNVRLHLIPALGTLKLSALRPDHLRKLWAEKLTKPRGPLTAAQRARKIGRASADKPLSARAVRYLHVTLNQALQQAVSDGDLPRNVALNVKAPKLERNEMRALSPTEVSQFLTAASATSEDKRKNNRLEALWRVAVYAGAREGELLALKWSDVTWLPDGRGTITIQRNLVRVVNRAPVFRDPKTAGSVRLINLPASVMAALKAHRDRQDFEKQALGQDYADYGLVFCTELGTPLGARGVIRSFKAIIAEAKLPLDLRVHDLRHTTGTNLLASGVDIATTARILGHASPQVTATVYAHVLPRATAEASDRLERVFQAAAEAV